MFSKEMLLSFNELELSIYNCITKNKNRIINMNIQDLAKESHVSTSTILRFCKKQGCQGYSEFKIRYKEYLEKEHLILEDTGETTFKSFISRINAADFQNKINEAFALLQRSSRIIFIGIGSSGILGKYGARYFSNVGHFSLYVDDPYLPILQDLTDKTVTIALSVSGNTKETVFIANQMKERGSSLLAITNNEGSILNKMADCSITYHVPEVITNGTNITTQVPVIFILETLAKKFYNADGDNKESLKNSGFF